MTSVKSWFTFCVLPVALGVLIGFLVWTAHAFGSYQCETSRGPATVNDFGCYQTGRIIDTLFTIHSYSDQISFASDGFFVYCWKNTGERYIVCQPHPAASDAWILVFY